jgi:putative DNA primase/helicase
MTPAAFLEQDLKDLCDVHPRPSTKEVIRAIAARGHDIGDENVQKTIARIEGRHTSEAGIDGWIAQCRRFGWVPDAPTPTVTKTAVSNGNGSALPVACEPRSLAAAQATVQNASEESRPSMAQVAAAALNYAKRGLPIFPCKPQDKAPLIGGGFHNATTDAARIKAWWTRWPDAMIGMPTGERSGVDVIDIDHDSKKGKDGFAHLPDWKVRSPVIVRTPRGGAHLWFKSDGRIRNTTDAIAPGVDTRGTGGYVILPPSQNGVAAYLFEQGSEQDSTTLPPFPADLQPRLRVEGDQRTPGEPRADPARVAFAVKVIPNGDIGWEDWNRIGMALWAATTGDEAGFLAFDSFSRKSAKYDADATRARWDHYFKSPPSQIGAGTLFHLADRARPGWLDEHDAWLEAEMAPAKSASAKAGTIATEPPDKTLPEKAREADTNPAATRKSSILICAADVVMRPKDWLWEGHLLRGAQELLTGVPGLGKSQVQICYVACTTTGNTWPNGVRGGAPANVIMLTAEDVLDQEVVPRLRAAGADLNRVQFLKCIKTDAKSKRQFLLGEDLDQLEKAVADVGNVGLITIDPITAYMGGKMDSHKTTEVRSQLGPLKDFAERVNVAISTITHPPKSAGQKAIDHFIGSQAFIAAGRIGHVCVEETEEEENDEDGGKRGKKERIKTGRILFANAKNNPHTTMPTLAYRIEEIIVGQDPKAGDNIAAPRVVWDGEPVDVSADEAVAAAGNGAAESSARGGVQAKVQAFLCDILKDAPVPQKQIEEEAARQGFSANQLRTAKEKLAIASTKSGFGDGWVWEFVL